MVDPVIEKLLTNGSPLVVLVAVVWLFLKFLKETRELDRELFRQMHNEHLAARDANRVALLENAVATKENTACVRELVLSFRK